LITIGGLTASADEPRGDSQPPVGTNAVVVQDGEAVGKIPAAQLESLGLAELTPITDEQGKQVRGSGGRIGGFSFSINLSGLIPAFKTDQYSTTTEPTSSTISISFPGTLLGLIFGSSGGSGSMNFGAGFSSFWAF
jgi:hypothetical protein